MKLYEQCPGLYTRGKLRPSHLDAVLEGGFGVVALTPQPEFSLQSMVPEYHHFPLPDGKVTPNVAVQVGRAVNKVLELRGKNIPVIVHCNAGRNRAILVASLAMIEMGEVSRERVVDHVRAVRPNALANPYFEAYIRGRFDECK
jgi:Predicted protein-tyrosine phosphatase